MALEHLAVEAGCVLADCIPASKIINNIVN